MRHHSDMERDAVISALRRPDSASRCCAAALASGAAFKIWDNAVPTVDLLATYRRRGKHVAAIGIQHEGFNETLADLERSGAAAVRLGQVTDRAEHRHYQLFLAAEADQVLACLWVAQER